MGEPIATVGDLAGICGHDGTNWEKILIDASKRLVVAVASAIASDVQLYGYYSGDWQKAPIPWGYSDIIALLEENLDAPAGANTLTFDTVPAGEVHFYTYVGMVDYNTAPSPMVWTLVHGGSNYVFYRYTTAAAGDYIAAPNPIVVGPGDHIEVSMGGVVLHDIIRATAIGYKIDLDL